MASRTYHGLLYNSGLKALMASMQLGGPDGLHYSYSYRVSFGKSKFVENYEDVVEDEEE